MKYRELLELYKNGKLDESKKEEVSNDIEKQEAIGEYLFDRENIDFSDEIWAEDKNEMDVEDSAEFVKVIRKTVRKTLIKTGLITGVAAVVVVLFIMFCLPHIVSKFYYDPGKNVAKETNQMSLDMAVYSELWYPTDMRDSVEVTSRGYGKYDIVMGKRYRRLNSQNVTVVGKVERNKISLYNPDILSYPADNELVWNLLSDCKKGDTVDEAIRRARKEDEKNGDGERTCYWVYENEKEGIKALNNLNDDDTYVGYVTFNKKMKYEDFYKFMNQKTNTAPVWCAVSPADYDDSDVKFSNIGMECAERNWTDVNWDNKKYPMLKLFQMNQSSKKTDQIYKGLATEKQMKQHLISMLRYMGKQETFVEMFDQKVNTAEYYNDFANNIEKNGFEVYGCIIIGEKKEFQELVKHNEIYGISAVEY